MIGSMAGNGSLAGALKACHSACLLEIFFFFFFFLARGTRDRPILATVRDPQWGPDAQRILATI